MANETRVRGKWHLMRINDECKLSDAELREFIKDLNDLTSHWQYEIDFIIYDKKEDFLIEGEFVALGCDSFVDNLEWLTDDSEIHNRRLFDKYKGKTNFIIFFQYDEFDEAIGTFNKEAVSSLIFHNRNYTPVLGNGCYVVKPEVRELLKKEVVNSRYFDNSIIEEVFYDESGKPYQEDLTKLDGEDRRLAILFTLLELLEKKDTELVELNKIISSKLDYEVVYDLDSGREFVKDEENQDWLDSFSDLYNSIIRYKRAKIECNIAKNEFNQTVKMITQRN